MGEAFRRWMGWLDWEWGMAKFIEFDIIRTLGDISEIIKLRSKRPMLVNE